MSLKNPSGRICPLHLESLCGDCDKDHCIRQVSSIGGLANALSSQLKNDRERSHKRHLDWVERSKATIRRSKAKLERMYQEQEIARKHGVPSR